MSRYRTGLKHPKTDAIVLAYLQGKCHKDVSREHDVPYTTCVEIAARYIKWVPVLKKSTNAKLALDSTRTEEYEGLL
jgi:hypothetical protein